MAGFVPLGVYLVYAMRRVECPECGVVVEQVPWATGKCHLTTSYRWGLAHRDLSGIGAIGVDEVQWRNGHTYLTLVYQIDTVKQLLWVAEDRTEKSLRCFFESLTGNVRAGIQFVASDMCKPYRKVIAEQILAAVHVLDRLHIMRNMNVAIDEVRRAETGRIKKDGYEPMKKVAKSLRCRRPAMPGTSKGDQQSPCSESHG
ncbi:MAG: transposase [Planctomycetia bacterium]|nr:transposase [Planctomycetia bacterium]